MQCTLYAQCSVSKLQVCFNMSHLVGNTAKSYSRFSEWRKGTAERFQFHISFYDGLGLRRDKNTKQNYHKVSHKKTYESTFVHDMASDCKKATNTAMTIFFYNYQQ